MFAKSKQMYILHVFVNKTLSIYLKYFLFGSTKLWFVRRNHTLIYKTIIHTVKCMVKSLNVSFFMEMKINIYTLFFKKCMQHNLASFIQEVNLKLFFFLWLKSDILTPWKSKHFAVTIKS